MRHMTRVTCDVSGVTCQVSSVTFFLNNFCLDKEIKLFGGGDVLTGPTLSSFFFIETVFSQSRLKVGTDFLNIDFLALTQL